MEGNLESPSAPENPFAHYAHLQPGMLIDNDPVKFDISGSVGQHEHTDEVPNFAGYTDLHTSSAPLAVSKDMHKTLAGLKHQTVDLEIDQESLAAQEQDPSSSLFQIGTVLRERVMNGSYDHMLGEDSEIALPKDNEPAPVVLRTPHDFSLEQVGQNVDETLKFSLTSDEQARAIAQNTSDAASAVFKRAIKFIHAAHKVEGWTSDFVQTSEQLRMLTHEQFNNLYDQWENVQELHGQLEQIIEEIGVRESELVRRGLTIGSLSEELAELNRASDATTRTYNDLSRRISEINQTLRGKGSTQGVLESDAELFRLDDLPETPDEHTRLNRTFTTAVEQPGSTESGYMRHILLSQAPIVRAQLTSKTEELTGSIARTTQDLTSNREALPRLEQEIRDLLNQKKEFVATEYQPAMAELTQLLATLEGTMSVIRSRSTQLEPVVQQLEAAQTRLLEEIRQAELESLNPQRLQIEGRQPKASVTEGKENIDKPLPEIDLTTKRRRPGLLQRTLGKFVISKHN